MLPYPEWDALQQQVRSQAAAKLKALLSDIAANIGAMEMYSEDPKARAQFVARISGKINDRLQTIVCSSLQHIDAAVHGSALPPPVPSLRPGACLGGSPWGGGVGASDPPPPPTNCRAERICAEGTRRGRADGTHGYERRPAPPPESLGARPAESTCRGGPVAPCSPAADHRSARRMPRLTRAAEVLLTQPMPSGGLEGSVRSLNAQSAMHKCLLPWVRHPPIAQTRGGPLGLCFVTTAWPRYCVPIPSMPHATPRSPPECPEHVLLLEASSAASGASPCHLSLEL